MKNLAAAFIFFTRLPFWRITNFNVPAEYFKQVINYWSVVGWLTAFTMASTLWISSLILPYSIAIALSILSRLMITGALHEDGLADFFDGFGGGNTRQRILAIMKDSHIGVYGVVALIFYFLLFYLLLSNLDIHLACMVILSADPLSKFISSLLTYFLPYARTEETSKSKTVYSKMSIKTMCVSSIFGILPMVALLDGKLWLAVLCSFLIFMLMIVLMKKKIGGYTGDCCGALFILCELSFYIGVTIILKTL